MKRFLLKLLTYISVFCCTILAFCMESQAEESQAVEVYQNYLNEVSDILAQKDFQFYITSNYKPDKGLVHIDNFLIYYGEGGNEKWKSMNITERYNYITFVIDPYVMFLENPNITEEEFMEEVYDGFFTPENADKVAEESKKVYQYIWDYWETNKKLINVIEPELEQKDTEIKKDAKEKQKQEAEEIAEFKEEVEIAVEKDTLENRTWNSIKENVISIGGCLILGIIIAVIAIKKKISSKKEKEDVL